LKTSLILGIALIVLGIIGLAYQGITYTTRDKIVDAGPVQVSADREHTIPITPVVAGLSLVAGVAIVAVGARRA